MSGPVFAGLNKGDFREPSANVDAPPLLIRDHIAAESSHLLVAREGGSTIEPKLTGDLLKARNNILAGYVQLNEVHHPRDDFVRSPPQGVMLRLTETVVQQVQFAIERNRLVFLQVDQIVHTIIAPFSFCVYKKPAPSSLRMLADC